jgi:hypothetical protein
MVPEDTYKETRILAIRKGTDIGSLVDEALREKIVREYQQMGLQPPFQQIRSQPQPQLQQQLTQEQIDEYSLVFRLRVPGLAFPITLNDLMKLSQNNIQEGDYGVIYKTTQKLSKTDKMYKNVNELEEDVMIVFNNDMKKAGIPKRITKCVILVDDKKNAMQFLEDERLKRKAKSISETKHKEEKLAK